jgi:hypothetical protein
MQPLEFRKNQTKIIDAPLLLTYETHHQLFGVQSFCLKVIPSLLTPNIPALGRKSCIQKHPGIPVSEPPLFMSSVQSMT